MNSKTIDYIHISCKKQKLATLVKNNLCSASLRLEPLAIRVIIWLMKGE